MIDLIDALNLPLPWSAWRKVASMDLFVVPTLSFRLLYGLLILSHARNRVQRSRSLVRPAVMRNGVPIDMDGSRDACAAVIAGPRVGEHLTSHLGRPERGEPRLAAHDAALRSSP